MRLTLTKEKVEFDFPNAVEVFQFDNDDKNSPYYHGVQHCMKSVDVVAVFEKFQLWIEIKEFRQENINSFQQDPDKAGGKKQKGLTEYENDLRQKFRDTYLYRQCEGKNGLPIAYIFLTNLPDDLCTHCIQALRQGIPEGNPNPNRWVKCLLGKDQLYVTNFNNWSKNFGAIFGSCTKLT